MALTSMPGGDLRIKTLLRSVVLLLPALLLLSGCAVNQAMPPEKYASLERVGVVSKIGSTLYKKYVGVTVFTNTLEEVDVQDWAIDATYENQLIPLVESLFGVEAVSLAEERERFEAVNTLNGPWSAPAFWPPNFGAISDVVVDVCQEKQLDVVLMVTENNVQDPFVYSNQFARGVGLFERKNLSVVHVLANVGLLDCETGAVLSSPWLSSPDGVESASKSGFVSRKVEGLPRGKVYSAWTEEEQAVLKAALLGIADSAWEHTLMKFIPEPQ